MSEDTIIQETLELVRDAQKPGVFNLAEVIKGRGYPQKDVTIYVDAASAFELVEAEDRLSELKEGSKEHTELLAKVNQLAETVKASALTFTMRGVNQGVVEAVNEKANAIYKVADAELEDISADWFKYYVTSLVATNVVKVTDSDGNVDEHDFTYEEMLEIRNNVPSDSWAVLVDTMQKLTLASGYFKGMTDAGFLPKS